MGTYDCWIKKQKKTKALFKMNRAKLDEFFEQLVDVYGIMKDVNGNDWLMIRGKPTEIGDLMEEKIAEARTETGEIDSTRFVAYFDVDSIDDCWWGTIEDMVNCVAPRLMGIRTPRRITWKEVLEDYDKRAVEIKRYIRENLRELE